MVSFSFLGAVSATNYTVTPTDSIQSKINNAKNGDTLNLVAGTYNQYNIKVNKSLTIAGPTTSSTPTAVINAQNQGRVFNITSGVAVNLKYLTITNGNASKDTLSQFGGGILNNGNLTATNCKINSNAADYGGGIFNNDNSKCAVTGSNITSNTGSSFGGGIYNYYSSCTVTGCSINSNKANVGGGICNIFSSCTVTGSNINSNTGTSIGGGIFSSYESTFSVTGSAIKSNTASFGGGIYNDNTFTVTSSNIISNKATTNGGGIYNDYGTCKVTGSNINSNTANFNGGGIYNLASGIFIVNGSKIYNNTAAFNGGGLYNSGTCRVTGCNFEANNATTSGNAIYNENGDTSTRVLHFNRFLDTRPGYEIYSASGNVDAQYNWWGSKANPENKVYGEVDTNPWLVLKISANPTLIGKGVKSNITANLRYDSSNGYHSPSSGYFPNGIPVKFSTTLGSVTSSVSTFSGVARAILTGGSVTGVADVFALLDEEIMGTSVDIDAVAPVVVGTDPVNDGVNVPGNKVIKVTFSENIKNATGFIELKNSSGAIVPITVSISGKILTINHAALVSGVYSMLLHTGCVADIAGNWLAGRGFSFTVDSTPPTIVSVDPANNAVNVPRNKVIKVTFSENIKKRTDQIELKDSSGTMVPVTVSVSGKVLTINHAALLANRVYTLVFRTGSVADLAGNWLASYSTKFTTGTT